MRKTISLLFAVVFVLITPLTVLAGENTDGKLEYNAELKIIEYYDADERLVINGDVELNGHSYNVSDGAVSLIDGKKRGTLRVSDSSLCYIDNARAFNEKEYYYLKSNVLSKKLTALVEISGVEYCFKNGVLFTGICNNKYYYNGLFDSSLNGYAGIDGKTYYFINGVLANGIYNKKYYVKGVADMSKDGIVKINNKVYYFKDGVLSTSIVSELYGKNKGKLVYYKDGELYKKTGSIDYKGSGYYIKKGVIKNGKIKVDGNYRYYSTKTNKLIKNKEFKIKKYLYTADGEGILTNVPLVYIQQNTEANKKIPYPSQELPKATVASGGCGVCTSLMIIKNTTTYSPSLKSWTLKMRNNGCRVNGGTDIKKTAVLMNKTYGFKYKKTKSIRKLKAHLKKGYMAICNVGCNGYFAAGGHYVVAAGITKDGDVIVLDPYMTPTKYTDTCKGVDRKKYFKYDSQTHEVTCSFKTMKKGSRGVYYYLFTPTENVALRKSEK